MVPELAYLDPMFDTNLKPGVPQSFINRLRAKQLKKRLNKVYDQKQAAEELLKIAEDVQLGKITEEVGKARASDLYARYGL